MDTRPWESHQLVFVGGLHRSGTTLVARAITSSPDTSGLTGTGHHKDEGQFLQDVYPRDKAVGGATRWSLDQRSHLTELHAQSMPGASSELWRSWTPYWDLSAGTLVEKTPSNIAKMRFLQELFPSAKFVVVTRHPITQALAVVKWSPRTIQKAGFRFPEIVDNWCIAHENLQRDALHIRSLRVVRYEHLLADPSAELEKIRSFLALPKLSIPMTQFDDSRMVSYGKRWLDARQGLCAATKNSVARSIKRLPLTRPVVRDALEDITMSLYRKQLDRQFADRIEALGYSLETPTSAARWHHDLAPGPGARSSDLL